VIHHPSRRGCAARRWTEFLLRARRGDGEAFAALAREMTPWLSLRLRRCEATQPLFRHAEDVEDALADAFAALWQKRGLYDATRAGATTWVWLLTRNAAVNVLRDRSRRRAVSLDGRPDRAAEPADRGPGPWHALERADEARAARRLLDRALAGASDGVRRAWELRFRDGKGYAEIARQLGVPRGTVATWLRRLKLSARAAG
jgi:RNA polymerase sigma-70 factor (ECF subfamily)